VYKLVRIIILLYKLLLSNNWVISRWMCFVMYLFYDRISDKYPPTQLLFQISRLGKIMHVKFRGWMIQYSSGKLI